MASVVADTSAATGRNAASAGIGPSGLPRRLRPRRLPNRRRDRASPRGAFTSHVPDANRLVLDALLAQRGDLRHTPAGIPAVDCVLQHASIQQEAGGERRVECELAAIAF